MLLERLSRQLEWVREEVAAASQGKTPFRVNGNLTRWKRSVRGECAKRCAQRVGEGGERVFSGVGSEVLVGERVLHQGGRHGRGGARAEYPFGLIQSFKHIRFRIELDP